MELFTKGLPEAGWTLGRLRWRLSNTLLGTDWYGKDILEIGCGSGDFSLYMALNGAHSVTAIDPDGAGASDSSLSLLQRRLRENSAPKNFTFFPVPFDTYNPGPNNFDLIFLINVIEHIHETHRPLEQDISARNDYAAFFVRVYEMLRPGGTFVVGNCSRVGLWAWLSRITAYHIRTPFPSMRKVEWELHQKPETWAGLMRQTGFRNTMIHWRVPFILRGIPRLADNPVFAFLTFSDYIVKGTKST